MDDDFKTQIYYGSISFYITIINSVFILYHVDSYVNLFKIDKYSFVIGETLFCIWNSVNDPLFGFLSDRNYLNKKINIDSNSICKTRLFQLKYFGPILTICFLFIWFPLSTNFIWLQFTLCLCLYDTFLTIIDLQYSALLADITISSLKRNKYNYYSSFFSACGSFSVFASYYIWCNKNYFYFQLFCVFLTVISFFGFYYSSNYLLLHLKNGYTNYTTEDKNKESNAVFANSNDTASENTQINRKVNSTIYGFIFQIFKHKNLLYFSLMNLIQVFSCHFNSNFFPLFLDTLLNTTITPFIGSCLLGFSFFLPHLLNMYLSKLCDTHGTYFIIKFLFMLKLALAMFMLLIGKKFQFFICVFIVRIFTEGTCKLLNLIITDLVDEDYVINKRSTPISALIFGTTNFIAKPGQTLAPLLGTLFISAQTGIDLFASNSPLDVINIHNNEIQSLHEFETYRDNCFHILILVPIFCAILQLLLWYKFDLHSKKLKTIKECRMGCSISNTPTIV